MKKLIEDDIFIFYFRKAFADIKEVQKQADKETLIQMNDKFCEFLKSKNFIEKYLDSIIPKPLLNITLDETNPLGHSNFSKEFDALFLEFVKEQKANYDAKEKELENN